MKVCNLLFVFLFLFVQNHYAQNCGNDSLVSTKEILSEYSDRTFTIKVDSFDLTNGMKYSSVRSGFNSIPGPPVYSQSIFVRNLISLNANQDTTIYIAMQGNGSGYDSLKKIEFTYNAANLPLSRNEYIYTGGMHAIIKSENWVYNVNNGVANYLLADSLGNISQINYTYSGNQAVSASFQNWSGSTWTNDMQYLFSYNGSLRDSIFIQKWDTITSIWVDSLSGRYGTYSAPPYFSHFCALITWNDTVGSLSRYDYYLDTQENFIRTTITGISSIYEIDSTFLYFNNHLKIYYVYNFDGTATNRTNFYYTPQGNLLSEVLSSQSSITSLGHTINYDSLQKPVNYSSYRQTPNTSETNRIYYAYSSANKISIDYFNINDYFGSKCQGDSLQTIPIVNGGCGPYTFSWTPSVWLSSDSVSDPKLMLRNAITYQVNVSDTTGHSATTTFSAQPNLYKYISIDTAFCYGCPVNLFTSSGNSFQWYRNDTIIPGATYYLYSATLSGNYTVRVVTNQCTYWTDPVQVSIPGVARLMGNIFLDLDSNCINDSLDIPLSRYGSTPYFIKINRGNYTTYVIADSIGQFDIPIDTGIFQLSIINPASFYSYTCPDSGIVSVNVPAYGDTISGISLALKPLYNCHRLGLNINAGLFRPCLPVNINLDYSNEGVVDEASPIINVSFPHELINLTASYPYTSLPDGTLSFSIPPLVVGTHGTIQINAIVECNPAGLTNATLCIDGEIKPVSFCSLQPDTSWDGSNIRVKVFCENDSNVCFTIYNDSPLPTGNMDTTSIWRLYADSVFIQQGTFILDSGQDTTLCFASDGKTFRFEADQLPGFPLNNYPSANIERCGVLPSGGSYSLNQILQHPNNNILPFYNIYCGIVRNSFDPNTKIVQPSGPLANRKERFRFRIDFQNTGTDTAFRVIVMDPISVNFDITSLQLLSSSHPYQFRIVNRNFIWEFNPILLPDSNVNEQASHGYVEFSLMADTNLLAGSVVENSARIYFDSNQPVATQQTSQIICDPEPLDFELKPIAPFCPGVVFNMYAEISNVSNFTYQWFLNNVFISNQDTFTSTAVQSGSTIKLLLRNIYACKSPDTLSKEFTVTYVNPTITYVAPFLISSPAMAYQWFRYGILISGANGITYAPVLSGLYNVQTTDSGGCVSFSNQYNFINTKIETPEEYFLFKPNPANDYFIIEGIRGTVQVKLFDMTGKLIAESVNFQPDEKFNSSKLESGIYLIQITSANINKRLPIVIQH